MILEDVHWADEMSIRLLAFVGRRIASCPALVLATLREEEMVDAPALRRALEDLDREEHFSPTWRSDRCLSKTLLALVTALAQPGLGSDAVQRLGEQLWWTK